MTKSQLLSGASTLIAPIEPAPAPKTVTPIPKNFCRPHVASARCHKAGRARGRRKSTGGSDREDAADNGSDDSGGDPDGNPGGWSNEAIAQDERFLTSKAVRARYGNCSDMWIYRRLHDGSGFPTPIEISGRRFWKLSALITWERGRAECEA
jgi:predicted DNA-binding transcriptional regulator AlpA